MYEKESKTIYLPLWKLLLFSLLTTAIIFCLLEAGLYLVGVSPDSEKTDPYVGFVPSIPLFIEKKVDREKTILETAENKLRFFNQQSFPKVKKEHTRRVFCLGGSTTYGRPLDDRTSFCGWLREYLHAADSQTNWEVINAGGISYASYRIAVLMQELVGYQPDLFIVYSGHNEFLEKRTYSSIIDRPAWIKSLHSSLDQTRTYTSVKKMTSWFEAQKVNDAQLEQEVSALLDTSVGLSVYRRDDTLSEQVQEHYRYNLQKIIDISRQAKAQLVFVTPASNLRSSSPFKSEFQTGTNTEQQQQVLSLIRQARSLRNGANNQQAIQLLKQAVRFDDRYAESLYQLGQAVFAMGQHEYALEYFKQARDEDVCPLRILSPMIETLREVALSQQIGLIDFDAMMSKLTNERYGHDIPGHELFYDHVHPSIQANNLLAQALLDKIRGLGLTTSELKLTPETLAIVRKKIEGGIDRPTQAKALRNLAKVLSWAGKNEDAARLAEQSLALTGNDATFDHSENLFILGLQATNKKDWVTAEQYFRQAILINPNYAKAHSNLALSLARLNRFEEAIEQYHEAIRLNPEHANAHYNLANTYRRLDKNDVAIRHYRAVLKIEPNDLDARYKLANTLADNGENEKAVKAYRSLLRLTPDDEITHYRLAITLIRLGQLEAARSHLLSVLKLRPDDAEAHFQLAHIFERNGELSEATRHFRLALRYRPGWQAAVTSLESLEKTH